MKKILPLLFFLIFLLNNLSATYLYIGNDNNNLSSFNMDSNFQEKIIIKGKDAYVTDYFSFTISENNLDQQLPIFIVLPDVQGLNLTADKFYLTYCSAENHNFEHRIENESWGLSCNNEDPINLELNYRNRLNYNLNLSQIKWGEREINDPLRRIYVQFEYIIKDFVLENKGENKFLWIEEIRSVQSHLERVLLENSRVNLIMPSKDTILESGDGFIIKGFDNEGRMILMSSPHNKDYFITYRDSKEENINKFFWFFMGISLGLISSFIFLLVSPEITDLSKKTRNYILMFVFLVFIGMLVYSAKFASLPQEIIFLIIIIFILPFSIKSTIDLWAYFKKRIKKKLKK